MSLKKMKKEYKRGRKDFDPVHLHVSVEDAWRDDSPPPSLVETTIHFRIPEDYVSSMYRDVPDYFIDTTRYDDAYTTLVNRLRGSEVRPRRVIQTSNPTEANAWIHSAWSIDNEE